MTETAGHQGYASIERGDVGLLKPEWPVADKVRAYVSTRKGGVSAAPYSSLNLGLHVGDNRELVLSNRGILAHAVGKSGRDFSWLEQVHGTRLVEAGAGQEVQQADGAYATVAGAVCAVMTADCLPVLLSNKSASKVMAIHAGWRGLAAGIVEKAAKAFDCRDEVLVWMGPAIGPQHFEVGAEVRDTFLALDSIYNEAFVLSSSGSQSSLSSKYLADIYKLCRAQLVLSGVSEGQVYGGDFCTYADKDRFYSYRRDGHHSGRMATMIWLQA